MSGYSARKWPAPFLWFHKVQIGQVDSPELPEMTENFTKVTKYLTKLRNINKLCLGKISRQKAVRIKFSVDSAFSNMFYGKKNSLNTSKNELIEIFHSFWVFEYALWQKTKTRKCWKSTESILNKKSTQC